MILADVSFSIKKIQVLDLSKNMNNMLIWEKYQLTANKKNKKKKNESPG